MNPVVQRDRRRRRRLSGRAAFQLGLVSMIVSACAGPRIVPVQDAGNVQVRHFSELARTAYETGFPARAEILYAEALARARAGDDAAAIGNSAYNLAALLLARDDRAAARPLLDEAEVELARAGEPLADVWVVKAKLAVSEHRAADALRWADQVVNRPAAGATAAHRVVVALLRGDVACDAKDVARARSELQEARKQLPADNAPLAAGIENLTGRLLLVEGRDAEAAEAFDREVDFYRQADLSRAMAHALERAAEAHARAGDVRAAAQRAYRAARSTLAQGDLPASKRLIARCRTLAEKAEDPELVARIDHLAAEFGRADHESHSP